MKHIKFIFILVTIVFALMAYSYFIPFYENRYKKLPFYNDVFKLSKKIKNNNNEFSLDSFEYIMNLDHFDSIYWFNYYPNLVQMKEFDTEVYKSYRYKFDEKYQQDFVSDYFGDSKFILFIFFKDHKLEFVPAKYFVSNITMGFQNECDVIKLYKGDRFKIFISRTKGKDVFLNYGFKKNYTSTSDCPESLYGISN